MAALGCHPAFDVRLCRFKHGLMPCPFCSLMDVCVMEWRGSVIVIGFLCSDSGHQL